MRVNTRRLFILILLAQCACVALGLGFYQIYVFAALASAADDEAHGQLVEQFHALSPDVQRSVSSLQSDPQLWRQSVERWSATAASGDHLLLLDAEGHVVASDGPTAGIREEESEKPLKLLRANRPWGQFGELIRGKLKDIGGGEQIAVAHGLAARDGYLLLTRSVKAENVDSAVVYRALWTAAAIALLWTLVLQAATLFMVITYFKQGQSREVAYPEMNALKQAQALVRTQETVIFGLAKLSDSRDADTGSHLERIAHYSSALATALRQRPEFREQITPRFIQRIGISSALHDIGKVGVEDSILCKPGSLTAEERARMQRHTQIGDECLKEIERRLGSSNFLQMAREISCAHHEWWDGQGYPLGLAGEQIPLAARIVALADVYDALAHKRVYKEAYPHEECVEIIAEAGGTQFDPRVVETFLQIQERFRQISEQFETETASSIDEVTERIHLSLSRGDSELVAQKYIAAGSDFD